MKQRVALVLAGDAVDVSWLTIWLTEADLIFAADGGGDLVLEAGYRPDFLVGDFDSASPEAKRNAKKVVELIDQDYSDCEKLLAFATQQGVDRGVVLGASGLRVDHMLGTVQAVSRWQGEAVVAYDRQLLRILKGPAFETFQGGGIISALPIERCFGVSMQGVKWPLDRVEMRPSGFSSLSNFSEGAAQISIESGVLAVFQSYDGKPRW